MASDQIVHNACPHLGLKEDRASHFAHPSDGHMCFSRQRAIGISMEQQEHFCFSAQYPQCPLYTVPSSRASQVDLSSSEEEDVKTGRSSWEILLWVLVSVVAFIAILVFLPGFLSSTNLIRSAEGVGATATTTPTPAQPPVRTTGTPLVIPTGKQPPPSARSQSAVTLPTLAPNAKVIVLNMNPAQSGWIAAGEEKLHVKERNIHVGFYQGKAYTGLVQFDLSPLPANSHILFAEIDLTGLSRDNLGVTGQWQAQLLSANPEPDWSKQNSAAIVNSSMDSQTGAFEPADLTFGQINSFVLKGNQLAFLEQRLKVGTLALRLTGPTEGPESIFTWDAGDPNDAKSVTRPVLRVVAVPGSFVVITNTPTPGNVLTAAAYVVAQTETALKFGTPTPYTKGIFATATPIVIIPFGGALNGETAVAQTQIAFAISITTGTPTPIPPGVMTATPVLATFTPTPTWTPQFLPPAAITPLPTPTPTGEKINYFATPIDPSLKNKIIFRSNRFPLSPFNQMSPTGVWEGLLTGSAYYDAVQAREFYAPDRTRRAIVAADTVGILQIMIEDLNFGTRTQVTHNTRGIAYDPSWSPDGSYIAYISEETGVKELYVYDIGNAISRRLTSGVDYTQANKHPSFAPNSRQIIFASQRGSYPRFQLWSANVDGSGLSQLVTNQYDETDPLWVK